MAHEEVDGTLQPLTFERFWAWLQLHANCIIRVGTLDSVVWDHEDHHWTFGSDPNGTVLLQAVRGKRPIADVFIDPQEVAFVSVTPHEEGEFYFDLRDAEEKVLYYFVLAHEYEAEQPDTHQWN